MIRRLLRSLYQKPKSTRDGIALAMASLVTLVIFSVWLYNMPARNAALEMKHNQSSESESPGFSQLFDGLGKQIDNLKEEDQEEIINLESSTEPEIKQSDIDRLIQAAASSSRNSTSTDATRENNFGFGHSGEEEKPAEREVRIMAAPTASNTASSSPNDQ